MYLYLPTRQIFRKERELVSNCPGLNKDVRTVLKMLKGRRTQRWNCCGVICKAEINLKDEIVRAVIR